MTSSTVRQTGWIRIGAGTGTLFGGLAFRLSVAVAGPLAIAVAGLIYTVTDTTIDGWASGLWTFLVLFFLIWIPLTVFASRPASVNLDRKLLRVGWRTVSFDQLRHAFHMPGDATGVSTVLQLELDRGVDARLPLSSDALPNLTLSELEVLLEVLTQAPIEPKPGYPVHSPIAGELGPRSDADLIVDRVSDSLRIFGRVAYTKPTLMLEVQQLIAVARAAHHEPGYVEPQSLLETSPSVSELRKIAQQRPMTTIMPVETRPMVNGPHLRGFWGTGGTTFRSQRDGVESWLRYTQIPLIQTFTGRAMLGWVIVIAALVAPWFFGVLAFGSMYLGFYTSVLGMSYEDAFSFSLWTITVSALLWPIPVWGGMVLLHGARVRRFAWDRAAALNALSRGYPVPVEVHRFFGAPFPERFYGINAYIYGIVLSIVAISGGFLCISLGLGTVDGPYVPQPWGVPLGIVLTLSTAPIFAGVLRFQRRMTGELTRAGVEWELLQGSVR